MLASVRPGDPDFVLARYYLGDIGLQQNDASLAQRYFAAAAKATDAAGANRLAAGIWRAHMATGQDQEADDLVTALQKNDPGSLALLEIRRLMQVETEERDARAAAEPVNRSRAGTSLTNSYGSVVYFAASPVSANRRASMIWPFWSTPLNDGT